MEFAKTYKEALTEKIREIGGDGKAWHALADFERF